MVADNGALHLCIYSIKKSAVSSYNSRIQHEQCLQCISDQFDVILMDKNMCFSIKNKNISKSDPKLLKGSVCIWLYIFTPKIYGGLETMQTITLMEATIYPQY